MENVVLNQKGNPVISQSVQEPTDSVAQKGIEFYARLLAGLREVNAILSTSSKKEKYEENLQYLKRKKVLNMNGKLRLRNIDFTRTYVYLLNKRLAEYLMIHFTLYELYVLFFQYQSSYGYDALKEAKRTSIKSINSEEQLTPTHSKRLKKLVWDMNLVWFGLILNFVIVQSLFWDEKTGKILRPEYKISKYKSR